MQQLWLPITITIRPRPPRMRSCARCRHRSRCAASEPRCGAGHAASLPTQLGLEAVERSHEVDNYAIKCARIVAAQAARQYGFGAAERDDLAQDLLVRLLEQRHHYDAARGAWSTFVSTVYRRHVLNYLAWRTAAKRDYRRCTQIG